MKKRKGWQIFAMGAIVGGTMTVPGASGGTMAMILGIYEDLIVAVGGIFRHLRESLRFLLPFVAGGLLGMTLLTRVMLTCLERFPMVISYFFLGAVAGGLPLICRQARIKKMTLQTVLLPLLGLFIVYGLAALPEGLFTVGFSTDNPFTPGQLLLQFLGGCILAIALILPGISVSQMLLMLGLYEPVLTAVSRLHFLSLLPLGLGAVICTLLVTRLLGTALEHHPQPAYLLILGFVLGSLGELYPGMPAGWDLLFSALAAIAGYQLLSRLAKGADTSSAP